MVCALVTVNCYDVMQAKRCGGCVAVDLSRSMTVWMLMMVLSMMQMAPHQGFIDIAHHDIAHTTAACQRTDEMHSASLTE